MASEELPTEIRDGVGINRDLRTAQRGIKYDFEAVPPGSAFRMEMLLENANPVQWALVLKLLRLLDKGQILIGGLTTRGLGRLRFKEGTVVLERTDAMRLLDGNDFERLDYEDEQLNATRL
jgi:CRISPR/Cas system CSM-associated protein Csm3 (group 7 of RAMP superfamily)